MVEGTLYISVTILTWPRTAPLPLVAQNLDDGMEIKLVGQPNGSLVFSARQKGILISEYETVPVRFVGQGSAVFILSWRVGWAQVQVNGGALHSAREHPGKWATVPLLEPIMDPVLSYEHPDAASACDGKIRARAIWFEQKASNGVPAGHRGRTDAEQFEHLERSIRNIRDYLASLANGSTDKLGSLAAEIRALVRRHGRYYDPLLLRMANLLKLPLPVYCTPDPRRDSNRPPIWKEAAQQLLPWVCSISKVRPNQVLMDLEDFLAYPAIIARLDEPGPERRSVVVGEMIEEVANTMGAAHYLPHASLDTDAMQNTKGSKYDGLASMLLYVGQIVALLGDYLLREARARGIIPNNPPQKS